MNNDLAPGDTLAATTVAHRRQGQLRAALPATLLLAVGLVALAWASLSGGGEIGTYAVMASPGSRLADAVNIVLAADGRLVQPGRFANIAIARSDHPDFAQTARRAGAWAVIAAPAPGGCLAPSLESTSS